MYVCMYVSMYMLNTKYSAVLVLHKRTVFLEQVLFRFTKNTFNVADQKLWNSLSSSVRSVNFLLCHSVLNLGHISFNLHILHRSLASRVSHLSNIELASYPMDYGFLIAISL